MKKLISIILLLILCTVAFAQNDVNTHKLTVRDSLKLRSRFVKDITDDSSFSTIDHQKLVTEYATYWFVLHHLGIGNDGTDTTLIDTTFLRLPLRHLIDPLSGNDSLAVDTTNLTYGLTTLFQNSKKLNIADLQAGTNVTITGAGTPASPYVINSSGGGGGGSGGTNVNIGAGFRWAIPGTNNLKTDFAGYGLIKDTSSNTNGITTKVDSSLLLTRLGAAAIYLKTVDTTNIANFSVKVRSLISGTAPIIYSNGAISITQSGIAANGYLSSTDWNMFNNKIDSVRQIIGSDSIMQYKSGTASFAYRFQRVFNIRDPYPPLNTGAKGDGITNDGPAIRAAMNAAGAAGVATVYVPEGIYIDYDTIRTDCNCQIPIPVSAASNPLRGHITILGESKPNILVTGGGLLGGAALTPPVTGSIIKSTLATFSNSGQAVIGTAQSAGLPNETDLSVENIIIQVKNNPGGSGPVVGGISYKNGGATPSINNVMITIDTSGVRSTLPTNDVVGIETPDNGAESPNNITNTIVVGLRTGYKIGEHVQFNQAQAWCSYYGFNFKSGFHSTTSTRTGAYWCPYDIYVSGACALDDFHMDTEWQQIGKWYDDVATVKDTANLATGLLKYLIVVSFVGDDNTKFSKIGGGHLSTSGLGGDNVFIDGNQTWIKNTGILTFTNNVSSTGQIKTLYQKAGATKWLQQMGSATNYADWFLYDSVNRQTRIYADVTANVIGIGGSNATSAATAGVFVDGSNNVTFDNSNFNYSAVNRTLNINSPASPEIRINSNLAAGSAALRWQKNGTSKWSWGMNLSGGSSSDDIWLFDHANSKIRFYVNTSGTVFLGADASTSAASAGLNISTAGLVGMGASPTTDKLEVTGNISLKTAGNKLKITTGTNASIGVSGAMTAGTITISTTAVTASSKIFLTYANVGGTQGFLSVGTITAGTSFVINSSSSSDTSTVNWWIIN